MDRVIIWGTGKMYGEIINAIHYEEIKGNIEIVGLVTNENCKYKDGYVIIPRNDLDKIDYDYIVIASSKFYKSIITEAKMGGVDEKKILNANILKISSFDWKKYISIYESNCTIVSSQCWGGITLKFLKMKFNTPFVNLFVKQDEFIELLNHFEEYMRCEIVFKKWGMDEILGHFYPEMDLNGITLHFNHYYSECEARNDWERRVKRINYENIFAVTYTDSEEILNRFSKVKYDKKLCFVNFKTDEKCSYFIDPQKYNRPIIYEINDMARGKILEYDALDFLQNRYYSRNK